MEPTSQPTLGGTPASLNEFTRLELYAKVQRPPEVKYKDLEAIVTSRMVRDSLKFEYRTDFLKVTSDTVLVPVSDADSEQPTLVQVQRRRAFGGNQYFWARQQPDREKSCRRSKIR